jgi:serine/threonine protein kinase
MVAPTNADNLALEIARRWCVTKGSNWAVVDQAGRGGTAPVFSVESPEGPRALKIYDLEFSAGQKGDIEKLRIDQQVALGAHSCPYTVQVFEGGLFEDRLFLLMNKAPGAELEKRLTTIPRDKIRSILDQVTQAVVFLRGKNICHRDIKSANVYISDDFEHATLLDLSVMRDIHDPVGIGTDHDGQLPIVATARYSPPEYLFRLIEPGPELWHALDVYQLGGLLHDLIMKQPMFANEYSRSKENRYRFAWAVATATPEVQAHDVDQDLIFTARRALDKNWERRSNLKLDDFLIDNAKQQTNALAVLGLAVAGSPVRDDSPTIPVLRARTREVATALETRLVEYLKRMGVTTTHINEHGDEGDASKRLRFAWKSNVAASEGLGGDIEYSYCLTAEATPDGTIFKSTASLRGTINSTPREENITLPDVPDTPAASDRLGLSAETTIGALAQKLLKAA